MVMLHIKRGDESQFLLETTVQIPVEDLMKEIIPIYNGRLKVTRISAEMEELADHGITLPPNMMGLADEQIEDLKLKDEWADKCVPSGGAEFKKDEIGRRNGQAPNDKMGEILKKTIKEAKDMVSKKNVQNKEIVGLVKVKEAIDILRGAVMIVYPMGLPPHDPIRMEFENNENLEGTQASTEILLEENAAIWWAGKEIVRGKKLGDFVGRNEKTTLICKLQKKGSGAPGREPVVTEDQQKAMMAYYYKKQEDMKKLNQNDEDSYMDSQWADTGSLRRQFQGLNNIQFQPGKRL